MATVAQEHPHCRITAECILAAAEFGTRIPIEYVLCRPVMCFFKFDKIKDKMLRLPLSYLQFFMCFEARRGRQAPNVLQLFNRGV